APAPASRGRRTCPFPLSSLAHRAASSTAFHPIPIIPQRGPADGHYHHHRRHRRLFKFRYRSERLLLVFANRPYRRRPEDSLLRRDGQRWWRQEHHSLVS